MARYKPYSYGQGQFIPVFFAEQILPGTFEFALNSPTTPNGRGLRKHPRRRTQYLFYLAGTVKPLGVARAKPEV
jgi:hypothetical protein